MIMPLQSLRAIAAILVIAVHGSNNIVYREFGEYNKLYEWLKIWGDIGVDIFFVLSGFVIAMTALKAESPGRFLIGRIFRIYPLYIICLAIYLVVYLVGKNALDYSDFIRSAFLVFQHRDNQYYSFLGPAWTLGFEFLFYFCCSVYIAAPRFDLHGHMKRLTLSFVVFCTLSYFHTIMIEFLLGVCIFYVYSYKKEYFSTFTAAAALLSIIALVGYDYSEHYASNQLRFFYFGFLASFVLCLFLVFRVSNGVLEYLGEISYSLYLTHMAVSIHLFGKIWSNFGDEGYFSAFLAYISISLVVASFFYHVLEKPTYSLLKQRFLHK